MLSVNDPALDSVPAATTPLVYVLLGSPGAGRRAVAADLIGAGLDPAADRAHVLLSANEEAQPGDATFASVARWSWDPVARAIVAGAEVVPAGATHVFFTVDGRQDPVEQIEALKPWLDSRGLVVARIFTVLDCQLAEKQIELAPWFAACVHFSDVVLLSRREGVANKWMSAFRRTFEDQCMPCLFEFVKEGRVKNPALLLDPSPRRLSQYFDASEWDGLDLADIEIGESDDEDGDNVRPIAKTELDPDDQPPVDPYLERKQNGRRVIELPDIRKFLA
jgi:hypothetical protein